MRTIALSLSRAETYTPVSYWLDQPIKELFEWVEDIQHIEAKQKRQRRK